MESSFLGLEIGKRSLLSHQKALRVIGHNISNANNESYSKQSVTFQTLDPLYRAQLNRVERPGQIGQGVEIASVRRNRDIFLDQRIYTENAKKQFWDINQSHLVDLENIYEAIGQVNLQEKLDGFWSGWENLILDPTNSAIREELLQNSLVLTADIRDKNDKLNSLQREVNEKLINEINEINQIADTVARLNQEIQSSRNLGDNPNDLLDKRDELVNELSKYAEVKVNYRDNDEFMVFLGGRILVQGEKVNQFTYTSDPLNNGLVEINWNPSNDEINTKLGSLRAHLFIRDVEIPNQINQLDTITTNLVYEVNAIHKEGFNNYGNRTGDFFRLYHPGTSENGNVDTDFDGVLDETLLFQIEGSAKLDPKGSIGQGGDIVVRERGTDNLITISYAPDEKIEDIINKVNNNQNSINLSLNENNQLMVKSRSNSSEYPFAIDFINDTGNFLNTVAEVFEQPNVPFDSRAIDSVNLLSQNTSYSRTPLKNISAWINVNQTIKDDSGYIATRGGNNYALQGDQTSPNQSYPKGQLNAEIASEISNLRFNNIFLDNKKNFNEFYVHWVGKLGSEIKTSKLEVDKYNEVLKNYEDLKQSISGVNIDEELANMVAYQHGYEAGGRIIRLMDELLEVIISLK